MLLHHYWEPVLGSQVKMKVLRVLCRYPSKSFTLRELAKLAFVVHSPVQRAVRDLEGMNLIGKEKHGTASLITINQKSVLYPHLKALFVAEEQTLPTLQQLIKKFIRPAKMVILFGSVQKGTEQMNSDVDLLIVTNNKKKLLKSLDSYRPLFSEQFGALLLPIILTEKEFISKRNKPFAKDLMQHYTLVQGEDLIKKRWKHD